MHLVSAVSLQQQIERVESEAIGTGTRPRAATARGFWAAADSFHRLEEVEFACGIDRKGGVEEKLALHLATDQQSHL